ncbi:Zinc finger SWIM-type [Pyrenophora seminiperda CCB06]|uniref:Zinc finger SWIM-type n=1 Tax=Pyrenophora seminiperda CCB06 TaxID=1302712 RepID=A0A3M7MI22_9PLEO|nr:Zinc finger SWIM-type [Pyrenophora seminiperda CCB06]
MQLSLGEEMVTTRAGAARAARANPQSSDSELDHPLPSIEPTTSPTPSLVISTKNLRYDVSALDSNLRRTAKKGLENKEIRVKYCAVADDEDNLGESRKKYFYLDDDITVAIGGDLGRPQCTCGANEAGFACRHIYWIGDQIISTSPDDVFNTPLHLSLDGSKIEDVKPSEILDTKGLTNIANELKWVYQEEDLPEDKQTIKESIIDILSCFEPEEALPREFRCPESPLTSERSKKYQEFADLFTQHAKKDLSLYLQLRKIVDPDFESRVFFEKVDNRIGLTFDALRKYIDHGPTNISPDVFRLDVPSCAKTLKSLVEAIDEFHEHHADVEDVAVRAAAALITILDRVMDCNVNAYENITWGLDPPSDPVESNLYMALIGTYADADPAFVLDALSTLPQEDVHRNHWETLQGIEKKLADSQTPPQYMNIFRNVVYENRKRPGSEARERESKRAMQ